MCRREEIYMSSTNVETRLFKNKSDLIDAINRYSSIIFTDVIINKNLLTLLTDNFIVNENGRYGCRYYPEKAKFVVKFVDLFFVNFGVNKIYVSSDDPIGIGSYSRVYSMDINRDENSSVDNGVIKLIRARGSAEKTKDNSTDIVFIGDELYYSENFYKFIIGFFTYILWISILYRYKERTNIDILDYILLLNRPVINLSKNTQFDVDAKIKTNSKYADDMIEARDLFFEECGFVSNDEIVCVGYTMDRLKYPVSKLLSSVPKNYDTVTYKSRIREVITDIMVMLYELHKMNKYGVFLSHRDLSTSNIMMDSWACTKIIDMDFAFTGVRFEDDTMFRFGIFFDEIYNQVLESSYDSVFFMTYMLRYHTNVTKILGFNGIFSAITRQRENSQFIDMGDRTTLWIYPYVAKNLDRTNVVSNMTRLIIDPNEKRVRKENISLINKKE